MCHASFAPSAENRAIREDSLGRPGASGSDLLPRPSFVVPLMPTRRISGCGHGCLLMSPVLDREQLDSSRAPYTSDLHQPETGGPR
jgi:hypothetical protein